MKILSTDLRRGMLELVPEDIDDLWVLYNVIRIGDRVSARTTREVKSEQEGARPSRGERIPLNLLIQVGHTSFQHGNERLRVRGMILEAPEKYGLVGKYHTLNILPGQRLFLMKDEWPRFDIERVKQASEERYPPMVVVALDDEEGAVAILRQHGYSVIGETRANLPGKLDAERRDDAVGRYYASLLKILEQAWDQTHGSVVIVGPGFWKEVFARYVRDHRPELGKSITTVALSSSGGVQGVEEALRSGVLSKVVERTRALVEAEAVEQVLLRLGSQRGDVAYGLTDVEKSVSYGAVERLLVTDKMLREAADVERRSLENLMKEVERMGGRVLIVHAGYEAGHKLTSIGGIAALLRFKVS
ncbi:MAG: mRNA surveillance protein pelota [Candidatus Bathyarchaeia archaeon]